MLTNRVCTEPVKAVIIDTDAPASFVSQLESSFGYFLPSGSPPETGSEVKLLVRFPSLEIPVLVHANVVSRRVSAGSNSRLPRGVFLRIKDRGQLGELRELAELSVELTEQRINPPAVQHEIQFDSVSQMAAVVARLVAGETRVRLEERYSADQPLTLTLRAEDRETTIDTRIVDGALDDNSRAQIRLDTTARAALERFGASLEMLPSPFH